MPLDPSYPKERLDLMLTDSGATILLAEETWAAIEAVAERVYREPLIDDPTAAAIARFSVLAHRDREVELGDVVRRLGASGASEGYRVRLSGPWPAYRFGGLPSERVASA